MNGSDIAAIFQGAIMTVTLSFIGILIGLPIGLGLALIRWANVPVVARIVTLYRQHAARHAAGHAAAAAVFRPSQYRRVPINPISAAILGLVMTHRLSTARYGGRH